MPSKKPTRKPVEKEADLPVEGEVAPDPNDVLLSDDISQEHIEQRPLELPIIQFGASPNNAVAGQGTGIGWFIEDRYLQMAGIDPAHPDPDNFRHTTRFLGERELAGWEPADPNGTLRFHFLLVSLLWEVTWPDGARKRRIRFARAAYKTAEAFAREKGERTYGRFQALVMCHELGPVPFVVTARGLASAEMDLIAGDNPRYEFKSALTFMMDAVTDYRKMRGKEGGAPRYLFRLPISVGRPEMRGGDQKSRVALPHFDYPEPAKIDWQYAANYTFGDDRALWGPGGEFDNWLADDAILQAWHIKTNTEIGPDVAEEIEQDGANAVRPVERSDAVAERLAKAAGYYYDQAKQRERPGQSDEPANETIMRRLHHAMRQRGLRADEKSVTQLLYEFGGEQAAQQVLYLDALALTLLLEDPRSSALIQELWSASYGAGKAA